MPTTQPSTPAAARSSGSTTSSTTSTITLSGTGSVGQEVKRITASSASRWLTVIVPGGSSPGSMARCTTSRISARLRPGCSAGAGRPGPDRVLNSERRHHPGHMPTPTVWMGLLLGAGDRVVLVELAGDVLAGAGG